MPSKRTMRKEKKAEVIRRLERLMTQVKRDREMIAQLVIKMKEEWYREYSQFTGAVQFLQKNGAEFFTKEEVFSDSFDEKSIAHQINNIKNDIEET